MTQFRVQGITCIDCAEKFRRRVADLPGVRSASLNTLRGTISIEGGVSLDRLRELGRAERYTISPLEDEPPARIARDPFPLGAAIRAACAAGALG